MPAVVLSRALRARGFDAVLLTEGRAVEKEFLARSGLDPALTLEPSDDQRPVAKQPKRRSRSPAWLWRSVRRARKILKSRGIDVVVATGGRTSVPVGLAARSLKLPLFLLEQNATTGRANRLLLPFANRLYLGLPNAKQQRGKALFTGTPLREDFAVGDRAECRRALGLSDATPVVLVTGGSQGAKSLNTVIPAALRATELKLQVVHLSGSGKDDAVRFAYAGAEDHGLAVVVRPLAMDMALCYGAADLVICRGGGGTVAELMATGRPSMIVPYPHHRDQQQLRNGTVLAAAGAAVLVNEDDLTVTAVAPQLRDLLADPDTLRVMGARARALAPNDSCAAILADLEQRIARPLGGSRATR